MSSIPSINSYSKNHVVTESNNEISVNIITKLQKLISKIFAQQQRISAAKSEQTEGDQKEYHLLTKQSASLMRKTGAVGLIATVASAGVSLGCRLGSENTQKVGEVIATLFPSLGSMGSSLYQAQAKEIDNSISLKLQLITDKLNQKQSDGTLRQDLARLLESAAENQKAASRAG